MIINMKCYIYTMIINMKNIYIKVAEIAKK